VANLVLVEATRGGAAESRHRGAVVIVNAAGDVIAAWGDVARPVFPRSAVKPLQTLALIESGGADAFSFSDAELALASSSHSAEPRHIEMVAALLRRIGLSPGDLECGGHPPMDAAAAAALIRAGEEPSALHNNCSGKHAGFLATALHLGEATAGYSGADHPVQRRLRRILEEMSGDSLGTAAHGVDGCGIPVHAMPLDGMARALARMTDTDGLPAKRAQACTRIVAAMAGHPDLVAGTGRFDTRAMTAAPGIVVKAGAEGVQAAILPEHGLAVALKIDDGAKRAAEVAMAAVLGRLGVFADAADEDLADLREPPVRNAKGDAVGAVRATAAWLDGPGWPA